MRRRRTSSMVMRTFPAPAIDNPNDSLGLILTEFAPPIKLCKNQYKRETSPPILLKY